MKFFITWLQVLGSIALSIVFVFALGYVICQHPILVMAFLLVFCSLGIAYLLAE